MSEKNLNELYGPDEIPSWEWLDAGNRFWYEERPRMIVHYYKTQPDVVSVFVNMDFGPTQDEIKSCIQRALKEAEVTKQPVNLRLNNWSGNTNAFWYADLVVRS